MTIMKCVTVAAAVLACAAWADRRATAQVLVPTPYTDGSSATDGFGGWYTGPLAAMPGPYNSAPIPGWSNPEESGQSGFVDATWRYPSVELFTR
ncbi:MAG: hypothetical protein ACLPKB_03625 [Xanthobacteraceae bacterium]